MATAIEATVTPNSTLLSSQCIVVAAKFTFSSRKVFNCSIAPDAMSLLVGAVSQATTQAKRIADSLKYILIGVVLVELMMNA